MANYTPSRVREGTPHKLGAVWDGRGTNFALFSAHATRVEVCLFDPLGKRELERLVPASRCPNAPARSGTATCQR